jgi:sodium/proline symporter/sodium/pantothenate symporter
MALLAVLALLAAALAWWGVRRTASPVEYFAAGQRAGAWLVGIAGTAAAVSAFTFVGGPGLFYAAGAGSLWIILSAPFTGALQCWAVGEPVVEMVRRHRVLTPVDLVGARFGPAARGAAALAVLVGCVASGAVQAKAAAVLGESFLGVPGLLAAAVAIAATTLYTAAGGMRAGLLADAVQGGVMAAAAVVLAAAALAAAGGPLEAVATLERARPELLGSIGALPAGRALSWYLLFALGTCAQPHYLQKFFFLRSPGELRRLPAVLTGALAATLAVWLGVGLAGTALAARGAIAIGRADDVAPAVMRHLGPWAVLLAGVAVLAALMSTTASFLNLAAAAVTRDLPVAFGRSEWPVGAARAVTALVGAAALALGAHSERTVAVLGVTGWGFFTAALLPVFTVGLAWPRSRGTGALAAIAAGALTDLALEAVRSHLPAALEPGLAGAAAGTLALVAVSLLSRTSVEGPRSPAP